MDLLEFTFKEFDFLSFSCETVAVASADANLSAPNSIAQSFSMSKFTFCVLVRMVFQTSLKLSYSLLSVDKVRPVSIVQRAHFHCASPMRRLGRQTVLQLSDMRANFLLVVMLYLEERLDEHIKPLRSTALKPCTLFVPNVFSTGTSQHELFNRLS